MDTSSCCNAKCRVDSLLSIGVFSCSVSVSVVYNFLRFFFFLCVSPRAHWDPSPLSLGMNSVFSQCCSFACEDISRWASSSLSEGDSVAWGKHLSLSRIAQSFNGERFFQFIRSTSLQKIQIDWLYIKNKSMDERSTF